MDVVYKYIFVISSTFSLGHTVQNIIIVILQGQAQLTDTLLYSGCSTCCLTSYFLATILLPSIQRRQCQLCRVLPSVAVDPAPYSW